MECKSMLFVKNHILIFETFQNLFPTASLIFTAVKLFHEAILKKNEALSFDRFVSIMTVVF